MVCTSKVILFSNENKTENITLSNYQYKAYHFEWSPDKTQNPKEEKENTNRLFTYNVLSNDTISLYLFTDEQYKNWNGNITTYFDEYQKSNPSASPPTIESYLKENKDLIDHLDSFDCPTKVKECQKKDCNIKENSFYLIIFGYNDYTSYILNNVEGQFDLKAVSNSNTNEPSKGHSSFLSYFFSFGKAYKTSFIGLTENDNEKESDNDPDKEADIFRKMVYIAIIVIPSLVIFLLLLFVYCHRSYKKNKNITNRDIKEDFFNPNDDNIHHSTMNHTSSEKGKKPFSFNYNDSTTLRNDKSKSSKASKLSALYGYSLSKETNTNTIYGQNNAIAGSSNSNSVSSDHSIDESALPFHGKYMNKNKKLDLSHSFSKFHFTRKISPQANISMPYKMNYFEETLKGPSSLRHPSNKISHSACYGQISRDLMLGDKSEDIVNTSIGYIDGEEFDASKNIYIKINRSTNKYNTEEYLKEDSINKIKEQHSCITQLSQFISEHENNKHSAIVTDNLSFTSTSSSTSSTNYKNGTGYPHNHNKSSHHSSGNHFKNKGKGEGKDERDHDEQQNDFPVLEPIPMKLNINPKNYHSTLKKSKDSNSPESDDDNNSNLDRNMDDRSIPSLDEEFEKVYQKVEKEEDEFFDEDSFISKLSLPSQAQPQTETEAETEAEVEAETETGIQDLEEDQGEDQDEAKNHNTQNLLKSRDDIYKIKNRNISTNTFGPSLPSPHDKSNPDNDNDNNNNKTNTITNTNTNTNIEDNVNININTNVNTSHDSNVNTNNITQDNIHTNHSNINNSTISNSNGNNSNGNNSNGNNSNITNSNTSQSNINNSNTSHSNINNSNSNNSNNSHSKVKTTTSTNNKNKNKNKSKNNKNKSSNNNNNNDNNDLIGRIIYTFYYSSTRILNVDDTVKIKKLFDNNWVKVERNPNEYFIIPLLVISVPFEEIRQFKEESQRHHTKMNREEMQVNERVEPSPEYLYHCAYISYKDFKKMALNSKWERKIRLLNQPVAAPPPPPQTSFSYSNSPPSPTRLKYSVYTSPKRKTSKVDLEHFINHEMNHYTTSNKHAYPTPSHQHTQAIDSQRVKLPDSRHLLSSNAFSDSSLDGLQVTGSSQDDIMIKENSKSRILLNSSDEEDDGNEGSYYHFRNISDPGMNTTTLKMAKKNRDDSDSDTDSDSDDEDDLYNGSDHHHNTNRYLSNHNNNNGNSNSNSNNTSNSSSNHNNSNRNENRIQYHNNNSIVPKSNRYSSSSLINKSSEDSEDEFEKEEGENRKGKGKGKISNRRRKNRSTLKKGKMEMKNDDDEF